MTEPRDRDLEPPSEDPSAPEPGCEVTADTAPTELDAPPESGAHAVEPTVIDTPEWTLERDHEPTDPVARLGEDAARDDEPTDPDLFGAHRPRPQDSPDEPTQAVDADELPSRGLLADADEPTEPMDPDDIPSVARPGGDEDTEPMDAPTGTATATRAEPTVALAALPKAAHTPSLDPGELSELSRSDFDDAFGDGASDDDMIVDDTPPESRRRRRGMRPTAVIHAVLIAAVVLLLLVCAALAGDSMLRHSAERGLADQLQSQMGPKARVSVQIGGTPFYRHALDHHFDLIKVSAPGAELQGLDFTRFDFTAEGVTTSADNKSSTIDDLVGEALITYPSISTKAGAQLAYASPTELTITYDAHAFGFTTKVLATGKPVLDVDQQEISLQDVHAKVVGVGIPDFLTRQIVEQAVHPIKLELPATLKVTSITMQPDGFQADVEGKNVKTDELK